MVLHVSGHFLSRYNEEWVSPFIKSPFIILASFHDVTFARSKWKLWRCTLSCTLLPDCLCVWASQIADTSWPESIVWGVGGLCCSYPTGLEKGISEPWLSLSTPSITPLLIITAEEVKRRRERRGRVSLNVLSIKSSEAEWDLSGCGGRLGEKGWVSAVYPALPLYFLRPSVPPSPVPHSLQHTPNHMETIQLALTNTNQLWTKAVLITRRKGKSTISSNMVILNSY